MFLKNMVVKGIQWENLSLIDIVSSLPADAATITKDAHQLAYDYFLLSKICSNILFTFIRFSNIVGRRGYDKRNCTIRYGSQKAGRISMMERDQAAITIALHNSDRI